MSLLRKAEKAPTSMSDTMNKVFNFIKNKFFRYKHYLQIALSIVILTIIFYKIDTKVALTLIFSIDWVTMILILSISAIKFFSQAVNWYYYLKIMSVSQSEIHAVRKRLGTMGGGMNYSFFTILKTHTIGLALRFFLPGGFATFGKAFYLDPEKKKDTVYSVFLEKFYIVWVIWFFAIWVLVFQNPFISDNDLLNHFMTFIFLLFAIILTALPFILPYFLQRVTNKEVKSTYYKSIAIILPLQILFEVLSFALYFIILQSLLGLSLSFFDVSFAVAIILVANTIPITYSGIGLRETASALLLPRLGIPVEMAVGVSLIIFLFNSVIPAIPGVFFIAIHKRKNIVSVWDGVISEQ